MKKIILSIFGVVVLFAINACKDDSDIVENPVQTGDEILFAPALPEDGIQSRTIYGTPDPNTRTFPVYWEEGDEIAIYCPQASNPPSKLVRYKIGLDPANQELQNVAHTVTKIDETGLQWGNSDLHKFYGFYPAENVKGNETDRVFHMNVPVEQKVNTFVLNEAKTEWKSEVDTKLAIMYAYRGQFKDQTNEKRPIDLSFKPLSTILEIVVQGPSEDNTSLTLTNINVRTTDGTPIVGDFKATITQGSNEMESSVSSVNCEVDMAGKVNNNLSIPCSYVEGTETKFVTLTKGQKLYVKAFLIPTTNKELDSKNVLISVSTTKGTMRKNLVNNNGESFMIAPHKVNRVTLPALKTSFDNAYWMSSLDPDIYLTELSIPGSKMTAETSVNGASTPYQSTTIEKQYKDGVRAFILQTIRNSDGTLSVARINKPLTTVLGEISAYLKTSQQQGKNEFAFVLITYNTGGSGTQKQWMQSLQNTINGISGDVIYKDEITPNTTLRDVFGKIVVKCNYNEDSMIDGVGTAPMLYTQWLFPYVDGGLDMPWNDPNGTSELRWLYQEVTSNLNNTKNICSARGYYHFGVGNGAEETMEQKKAYIELLFNKSLDTYKEGAHNTWFMNDLGGNYTWCDKDSWHLYDNNHNVNIDVINFTKEINQLGIDLLQRRTENAGLGLIFMNYANREEATGVQYKSDLLLQTIIDNNFKFALLKKTSGKTTNYSAEYKDGGNAIGWDN